MLDEVLEIDRVLQGHFWCRERKWKISQAKKFVRKTAASERNLELRESARQREQSQQLKKKALLLGKEVSIFRHHSRLPDPPLRLSAVHTANVHTLYKSCMSEEAELRKFQQADHFT